MSSSAGSERCKKDERNQRTFKLTGVVSDGITLCKGVKRRKSCLGECRKKKRDPGGEQKTTQHPAEKAPRDKNN